MWIFSKKSTPGFPELPKQLDGATTPILPPSDLNVIDDLSDPGQLRESVIEGDTRLLLVRRAVPTFARTVDEIVAANPRGFDEVYGENQREQFTSDFRDHLRRHRKIRDIADGEPVESWCRDMDDIAEYYRESMGAKRISRAFLVMDEKGKRRRLNMHTDTDEDEKELGYETGVRVLCFYSGVGSSWVANNNITEDGRELAARGGFSDSQIMRDVGQLYEIPTYWVAFLKKGFEGIVHGSTLFKNRRGYLQLDVVE